MPLVVIREPLGLLNICVEISQISCDIVVFRTILAMTEVEEHSNLEKVTDFVEEKELDNEETMNALSSLADPAQALAPRHTPR